MRTNIRSEEVHSAEVVGVGLDTVTAEIFPGFTIQLLKSRLRRISKELGGIVFSNDRVPKVHRGDPIIFVPITPHTLALWGLREQYDAVCEKIASASLLTHELPAQASASPPEVVSARQAVAH
ncbi:MAG: hypothetical protein Greene041679_123 [Parcubacteria group bacterium Greene0416_79]|nr:MAG: hypothetical protein Greene041679_123 [Parcubacteria group bacterium Greene0416_79]